MITTDLPCKAKIKPTLSYQTLTNHDTTYPSLTINKLLNTMFLKMERPAKGKNQQVTLP